MLIALTGDLTISELVGIEQYYTGEPIPEAMKKTQAEEIGTEMNDRVSSPDEPDPIQTQPTESSASHTNEAVESVRTMEEDMDRVHGYGAYRKMYPSEQGDAQNTPSAHEAAAAAAAQATEESAQQDTSEEAPAAPEDEDVISATPQDEVLKRSLTETPSYDEPSDDPQK